MTWMTKCYMQIFVKVSFLILTLGVKINPMKISIRN